MISLRKCILVFVLSFAISANVFLRAKNVDSTANKIHIPIGGNSWVHSTGSEKITDDGLVNWSSEDAVIDSYVLFTKTGKVQLSLNAILKGESRIRITIAGISREIEMVGEGTVDTGEWTVDKIGYTKISIQGLSKTGEVFAELNELILEGSAVDEQTAYVKDNKDNYFYWGRRGPSVHLNYPLPEHENIEWFYNEVTVPEKEGVIGSYFMANGFGEGYFGMQVNSDSERRILFSVWSPFETDDPKSIPLDKRIVMLGKGTDVYTGEFGNEGSGGQSYLKYNWKAGNTYKFLLNGKPSGDSTTTYTAYFFAPEKKKWQLIASFKRPKTHTYLKKFHSFLENFIPETGYIERKVNFGNQWVRNSQGKWTELTKAKFTADATARKGYRMDYAGGQSGNFFYLRNCGFFNGNTKINEAFGRQPVGKEPVLDLNAITRLTGDTSK